MLLFLFLSVGPVSLVVFVVLLVRVVPLIFVVMVFVTVVVVVVVVVIFVDVVAVAVVLVVPDFDIVVFLAKLVIDECFRNYSPYEGSNWVQGVVFEFVSKEATTFIQTKNGVPYDGFVNGRRCVKQFIGYREIVMLSNFPQKILKL
uniref:Uncharacterized protein n=1 Tax=Bracon brevicornis TaxID=1563983 RepID=A0A6V7L8H1_9HYME